MKSQYFHFRKKNQKSWLRFVRKKNLSILFIDLVQQNELNWNFPRPEIRTLGRNLNTQAEKEMAESKTSALVTTHCHLEMALQNTTSFKNGMMKPKLIPSALTFISMENLEHCLEAKAVK